MGSLKRHKHSQKQTQGEDEDSAELGGLIHMSSLKEPTEPACLG